MKLENLLTPPEEIVDSRLVVIHISAPHIKCPACGQRNTISKDFWIIVKWQGYNDVPGYCPECKSLYTIRIKEKPKSRAQLPLFAQAQAGM